MLELQFLVFILLRGIMSQGQWRCSNNLDDDFGHFFPDLGENQPNPSLWRDSMQGVSHVYPIPSNQGNCSGMVSGMEFCYRAPSIENHTSLLVFTLLIVNQSDDYFTVMRSIPVYSTPVNFPSMDSTGGIPLDNSTGDGSLPMGNSRMDMQQTNNSIMCRYSGTEFYCCDNMILSEEDRFYFPTENNSIGITTPSLAIAVLQKFQKSPDSQMYSVPFYLTTFPLMDGNTYNITGMGTTVSNDTFPVLRLHIRPAPVTEVTTTSIAQVSTGTSSVYVPTSPSTGTSASYEIRVSTSYPIPELTSPSIAPASTATSVSSVSMAPTIATSASSEYGTSTPYYPMPMTEDSSTLSIGERPTLSTTGAMSNDQWRCSSSNISDNEFLFPNIGGNDPDPSLWQDTMRGVTYVYPIPSDPGNCSGRVTDIQFCYRTLEDKANELVFTLHTLNQSSDYFNVTRSIAVNTINDSSMCNGNDSEHFYCCKTMILSEEEKFQFPTSNFAIGITTSNSDTAILQEFTSSFPQLSIFVYNISLMDGNIYNISGTIISNPKLRVLRLHIRPLPFTEFNTPSTSQVSTAISMIDIYMTPTIATATMSESRRSITYTITTTEGSSTSSNGDMSILSSIEPHMTSSSTSILSKGEISPTPTPGIPLTPNTTPSMSSSGILSTAKISMVFTASIISVAPSTTVSSGTTPEGTETAVAEVVGGVLGAVIVLLLILVILFAIILGLNRRRSKRTVLTFSIATHTADVTRLNNQIQDLELSNLRNEYVEIGPHSNSSNKSSYVMNGHNDDPPTMEENNQAYYSVNEEMPTLLPPSKQAVSDSTDTADSCHLQDLKPSENEHVFMNPADDVKGLYLQLEEMLPNSVCKEDICINNLLGSGQFCDIFEGVWERREDNVKVAVKILKEGSTEDDKLKFLQEAAIMGQFKHPNVVTMYGLITDGEPILLVLELLKKGDLRKYLLSMRTYNEAVSPEVDDHELLSYCRQIASGMAYLSNKSFVHRDLAARNILVSGDRICKIADFGMARDLMDENYYVSHGGLIPVKWTAPEALSYKEYSTASDVWSFGVVMYEIWSVGHKPFEAIDNNKMLQLINDGYRLPPPPGCPHAIYSIMMSCWNPKANRRPDFTEVSMQLSVSNSKLLHWLQEDKSEFPEASNLGAKLTCAEKMYRDLQLKYKSTSDIESQPTSNNC